MERRDFLKAMFWAPVLAASAAHEEIAVRDPVDTAIRNKRIILGHGGMVRGCDFVDCTVEARGNNVMITDSRFTTTQGAPAIRLRSRT